MTDVDTRDTNGCTALFYAAENGYTEVALKLLDKGADMKVQETEIGNTPVHRAAWCGHHRYNYN